MGNERASSEGRDQCRDLAEPAIRHSSPGVDARAGGASVVQVELGLGRNAAVVLWFSSFVAAAAIILACMAWYHASLSERETRIFNDNVLRIEARLEAEGIITHDQEH